MKKALQIVTILFLAIITNAQNSVNIQINHLLNGEQFENEVNTTNDLGNEFMIDRLEYYLSGFSIVHDGGTVTEVEDLYVLVSLLDSSDPTIIELGDFAVSNLEAVRFHFGVDEQANHSDPSLYHGSHALAPKFPSMHWGWAAGYRFIALEGKSGANLNQELQFHCIGDEFYSEIEFPVTMSGEESYSVSIDAEYTELLSNIDVSSGIIIHGGTGEMPVLSTNISEKVFSTSSITSTSDSDLVASFEIYPNPVTNGIVNIQADIEVKSYNVNVYDVMGKMVLSSSNRNLNRIELSESGMYYISISDDNGSVLATRKVVVQ